jgi:hypothetical protein
VAASVAAGVEPLARRGAGKTTPRRGAAANGSAQPLTVSHAVHHGVAPIDERHGRFEAHSPGRPIGAGRDPGVGLARRRERGHLGCGPGVEPQLVLAARDLAHADALRAHSGRPAVGRHWGRNAHERWRGAEAIGAIAHQDHSPLATTTRVGAAGVRATGAIRAGALGREVDVPIVRAGGEQSEQQASTRERSGCEQAQARDQRSHGRRPASRLARDWVSLRASCRDRARQKAAASKLRPASDAPGRPARGPRNNCSRLGQPDEPAYPSCVGRAARTVLARPSGP